MSVYQFYGFSSMENFQKSMNKKMSGGQTMYAPPALIGRRENKNFNIGFKSLMRAPWSNGTIPGGTYKISTLCTLPKTYA
jgi:hypothetical protein